MMASIPNMRSTPLPIPTAKTPAAGDPASGGFAVQLPVAPATEEPPAPPGQPGVAAPDLKLVPIDPLNGIAPHIIEPEGAEDGEAGDEAAPAKSGTDKADKDAQPAVVITFIQQQVPPAPVPQILPAVAGTDTARAEAAGAAAVPQGAPGAGKKAAQSLDTPDVPKAEEADAAALDSAVKALLQRKSLPTKQIAAAPKGEIATAPARADPAPAKPAPKQVAASPAPAAIPTIGPAPAQASELPQPALSFPAAAQPVTAAADKTATVDGTRTTELAAERKLDLSRDTAWLDRLARDISRAASDDSPLRFRLHPQTLGSLHVELQQGDRGTAVRMTVDTEAARQILTDAQPRLAAEARAQGVRIAETHVEMSSNGRQAPGDQRRQDEARQTPIIRTAPGAVAEATTAARAARRARLDRYA